MKLITLDWEGTLVDFQWNLAEAVAEATALLEARAIPLEGAAKLDYAAIYNLVREKSAQWGYGNGSLISLIDGIYDRYDLDAASRWTANRSLSQTLKGLEGFRLALVTNIGRLAISGMLARFGLQDSFGLVVTRNDIRFLKPSPEGIHKAVAWAGTEIEETMHIGDSLSDLYAARAAGVKSGVVLGGQDSPETLLREKPDLVLDELDRLPAALREIRHGHRRG